MKQETKNKLKAAGYTAMATLGGAIIALVIMGVVGCSIKQQANQPNEPSALRTKKEANNNLPPKPTIRILENQESLYESFTYKVGKYVDAEEGYELHGNVRYYPVEGLEFQNYWFILGKDGNVPTNDSNFYTAGDLQILEINCYAVGELVLAIDDGNNYQAAYFNNSHYYGVKNIMEKDGVVVGYSTADKVYGLSLGSSYHITQALTNVPPYNIYGQTQKFWGGDANMSSEANPLNVTTFGFSIQTANHNVYSIAPYDQPIVFHNKLVQRVAMSVSTEFESNLDNTLYGIDLLPGNSAYFKADWYISFESKSNFVIENETHEMPAEINYTWNTYYLRSQFPSSLNNVYNITYPEVGNAGGVLNSVFSMLAMAFTSLTSIFNLQVFGTFTIGFLLVIPLVITIITLIFKAVKK